MEQRSAYRGNFWCECYTNWTSTLPGWYGGIFSCNPRQKRRFQGCFCDLGGSAEHRPTHYLMWILTWVEEKSAKPKMIRVLFTAVDVIGAFYTLIRAWRCILVYVSILLLTYQTSALLCCWYVPRTSKSRNTFGMAVYGMRPQNSQIDAIHRRNTLCH